MAKTRKKPKLREFIFTGTIELHGVQFFILAEDEDEARAQARGGDYIEYETGGAETVNWTIDPNSLESNE